MTGMCVYMHTQLGETVYLLSSNIYNPLLLYSENRQCGTTYLRVFVSEVVEESGKQLIHAINPVTVLSQNPDHGGPVGWGER